MGFFDKLFGKRQNSETVTPSEPTEDKRPPMASASPELAEHSRTAWIWSMSDGEAAADATRIGGRPIMGEEEIWPGCGDCKNPLTFMMQCNLDALPDGMDNHESGILRFFYCLHDDCAGMGGWDPFDPQHHLSILQGYGNCRTTPKDTILIPAQYVSDLTEIQDVPHWPDRRNLNLPESDDQVYAADGHKYAGWPHWIQGAERPSCPECKAVMVPFIQLDNAWYKDFNFGGGVGHISQCTAHPDQLAFGWACG